MVAGHRLVGRDSQVEVLEELLDELGRGHGGALLLAGDPGIGKTRLAEELVVLAAGRGARTAWATGWNEGGAPPLWPWTQLLRVLGLAVDLEQAAVPNPEAADAARFEQFDKVASALREATRFAEVVLVLDDLHWTDPASMRLLAFLVDALRDRPCLFVGTYRPEELPGEERETLARLGMTLSLSGLDREAVQEVLAMALGQPIDPHVAGAIEARCDGNPLFVWEFGRLLGATGRVDVAAAAIPPAVTAVIQRRMARLSEAVVASLQAAAILGKEFSARSVRDVTGDATHQVDEALADAEAAGLVLRTGGPRSGYAFVHDLVRDVLVEGMAHSRRAVLHESAAALHERRAESDPGAHAAAALHLQEAGPQRADDAARHWEGAARWAERMLAYEGAASYFARARALTALDDVRQADLLLAEAGALLRAGDLADARARFSEAADTARLAGRPDCLAAAALGIGAGVVGWEVPMWDQAHVELVAEALASLPPGEGRLRSMLLARLSVASATPESFGTSERLAMEALDLARRSDDPMLEAQALASVCDALGAPWHAATRRRHAESIVAAGEEAGDRVLTLLGRRLRVVALLELGDFPALDREIALFERDVGALHQPLLAWYAPLFRGMRALLRGDIPEAQRFHAEVARAELATGSANAHMLAATLGLGIEVRLGREPDRGLFEDFSDLDPVMWASYAASLGYVAVLCGDRARAEAMVSPHAGSGFDIGSDSEHLVTLMMFARTATAIGDLQAVARLYELLAPHSGLWIVDGIAAVCWGPVDLELARLAVVLDRVEDAGVHLDSARPGIDAAGAELLRADLEELEARIGSTSASPDPARGKQAERRGVGVFRRGGEFWTLTYGDATVRMKHAKGLADIARLLAVPGREMHVADLYAEQEPRQAPVTAAGDLGEVLDATARRAYKTRIVELEEEAAAAEAAQDLGRVEQARSERDFLVAELAAALGLGGRPRRTGAPHERARKAVSMRIRLSIDRVAEQHELLARHLRNSIRTGLFCSYQPEHPVDWML